MKFKLNIILFLLQLKFRKFIYIGNVIGLQQKLAIRLLKVLKRSVYYKNFLEDGLTLDQFPIMNKTIFMENFDTINTCGIKLNEANELTMKAENSRDFSPTMHGITAGLSTGTSGNRGIFLVSDEERARWMAAIFDRVIGFKFKKRKVAFFLRANSNLYESAKSAILSYHFFDLFEPISEHINLLNKLQPDILIAQPSMLSLLAAEIEKKQLNISVAKVISVAEVLEPQDAIYLSKVFKQTIHQVYQCTEGFLAATCKLGVLHFNEDFIKVERKYLDTELKRFHPVITDLMRTSQPLIRYEINDIVVEKKNCLCGNKFMAIEKIEGRSDDMLTFWNSKNESIKIFPDSFRRAIVLADETINDYCLQQKSNSELYLYINNSTEDRFAKCCEAILQILIKENINYIAIKQLDKNPNTTGNKYRRIRNDIPQTH